MATQSIHNQIVDIIERQSKGSLIFPPQFLEVGSESAIRMSLSRLAKEGKVERLAHGIYIIPKEDPMLGKIYPPIEEMAKAIAERDNVNIKPAGAYALNRLGLSTQVPMNYVYITDGAARSITIGKSKIKFKATVPKKLATKGPISGLVIQALEELGPDEVTAEIMDKITNLLKKEDPELLRHDAKLTSAWIARIFYNILQQQTKDDTVVEALQERFRNSIKMAK
jgi:predicted transcriptional regulator of viral defense system